MHTASVGPIATNGAFSNIKKYSRNYGLGQGNKNIPYDFLGLETSKIVPTASENRPNNLNLKYFIKV